MCVSAYVLLRCLCVWLFTFCFPARVCVHLLLPCVCERVCLLSCVWAHMFSFPACVGWVHTSCTPGRWPSACAYCTALALGMSVSACLHVFETVHARVVGSECACVSMRACLSCCVSVCLTYLHYDSFSLCWCRAQIWQCVFVCVCMCEHVVGTYRLCPCAYIECMFVSSVSLHVWVLFYKVYWCMAIFLLSQNDYYSHFNMQVL